VIEAIDKCINFGKKFEFFSNFLCCADEVLVMCLANIGKYPDIRLDDRLELIHLIRLCKEFNSYYVQTPVIKNTENLKNARCAFITGVKEVLASGLTILGIDVLEQM
jgi:hypothetical protein